LLGGGLENRRSATLNKVEAYRYYGLGDRCHHLREYFVGSNQASATRNYSAAIGSEHPATIRIDSRPPQHEKRHSHSAIDRLVAL